ncbi:SHC-transforming protein 2 [Molothrus ater]|uniref:SHC-transforming protein 2 n=2 Tax=Molothrus TaxID=84832 RepID=UPI00174AFA1B|nr:SHC-transforming protein 2 [Molothrus ater]XP_036255125.1 SHC-transforming protein 2 [Molothrus ater]XP_036255126.1 SHC-transforming protein 2 [Molothrus ater]XP_054373302.1 SHC-transforming protein 2 [Molothrus ater]XP_054373303.1 SHC-transforming protein 2 [Molothrus ater]
MLPEPKYDRFRDEPLTAPMPSPAPAPCPAAGEEPEHGTTFCALLPRMPQWKFPGSSGFLGRGPAGASRDAPAAAESPSGLAAVLGACEPLCAAPCALPGGGRARGAAGRARGAAAAPAAGARPGGDEWSRKGSFIRKPAQGWLHPDERVLGPGVSYIVRYMGCIEVLRSMRSLDFNTRTQVTREAINRLYEAVPGVKGIWKKKAPNKALFSILGKSNLHFAGMSIAVNISVDGLNLMIPTTRQIIANHHMQSISFASGGDMDTTDYVAYVAKDPINQRACHILECCEGLAQSVISTVGQAFELRFKQYLHSPPKVVVPPERALAAEESAWGEDEEAAEHDYYNSIPGKEPPPGGLVDSRLRHIRTQPPSSVPSSQGGLAARRDPSSQLGPPWDVESQGQPCDGYLQADSHTLGPRDYEEHMYVNTQSLDAWEPELLAHGTAEESPKKDLFDMRPFEDALKLHECMAGGASSPPIEDQWPSPPTRKAPIAPTEEQLRREPWYHGRMSRRDAERLLQMDGDFLVRDSLTNPGQYVLTGMHSGQPKHLLLVDPEGVVRTKDVLFESISHLISHHRQNEQPIVAAESELHLRQVVQRKQ